MLLRGLSECYCIHFSLSLKDCALGIYWLYSFLVVDCVVPISGLYNITTVMCGILVATLAPQRVVCLQKIAHTVELPLEFILHLPGWPPEVTCTGVFSP